MYIYKDIYHFLFMGISESTFFTRLTENLKMYNYMKLRKYTVI